MGRAAPTATSRYAEIVQALSARPDVAVGAGRKKGFGASALAVRGRIFAMLASGDRFVVKLPKTRVEELVAAGAGAPFDSGRGRVMKEWLVVAERGADWQELAEEARAFVATSS